MFIHFPTNFIIEYPEKNEKYYDDEVHKDKLKKILLKGSNDKCMYCGKRLKVSKEIEANLEHTIEKSNADKDSYIRNCKFNISITCASCNQKYKSRMIEKIEIIKPETYEKKCKGKECKKRCNEMEELMLKYIKKNKIIVQPSGVTNSVLSLKQQRYEAQYSFLEEIIRPAIYDRKEKKIDDRYNNKDLILEHIARFHLNNQRTSSIIIDSCEDVLKKLGKFKNLDKKDIIEILKGNKIDNVIEEEFLEFLEKNIKNRENLQYFCELIILLSVL